MRGITPVIAIILLLLMAVAAAGGFYFVYQGFTESGEESGSTQIEQLGETSLAAIQIESAAGGRLYVRNVGASDIDLSKMTVYVENQPVSVNRSSDTLAERERAVLKLTEMPSCSSEKCEVKISGTASTSKKVDLAKLLCSSDADCYSSESCTDGVCVGEGEEETTCGNGICETGEYGYECFVDCHPESLLLVAKNSTDDGDLVAIYDWNGTSYARAGNLTNTDLKYWWLPLTTFLPNGDAVSASYFSWNGQEDYRDLWHTRYDGSSWSSPQNITNSPSRKLFYFGGAEVNSTEDIMAVWVEDGSDKNEIYWASYADGSVSPPSAIPDTNTDTYPYMWSFAFAPDDEGYIFFTNSTLNAGMNNQVVKTVRWNGDGWGSPSTLVSYPSNNRASHYALDFASDGNGIAAWVHQNSTNYRKLKYATYDGSAWTYQGNFDDSSPPTNETTIAATSMAYDHLGNPMFAAIHTNNDPSVFTQYHRYANGGWSEGTTFPTGMALEQTFLSKAGDGSLFAFSINFMAMQVEGRSEYYWSSWDGSAWGEFVEMGE